MGSSVSKPEIPLKSLCTANSLSDESEKWSNRSDSLSIISYKSDESMNLPSAFSGELQIAGINKDCLKCSVCENILKEPVSIPCGDTFCKTCIQNHLKEDCYCPKCKKRFETCPDLTLNKTLDHLLKQMGFSPALPAHIYAGPGDVRHHYTVEQGCQTYGPRGFNPACG